MSNQLQFQKSAKGRFLLLGLKKDAISKQNSAAMVEQLATMSQQRQKIIARNFANQFVKPLSHEIYPLVVENGDLEKIVEWADHTLLSIPEPEQNSVT